MGIIFGKEYNLKQPKNFGNARHLIMIKMECDRCHIPLEYINVVGFSSYNIIDYGWVACDNCKPAAEEHFESIKNKISYYELDSLYKAQIPINVSRSSGLVESNWFISKNICMPSPNHGAVVHVINKGNIRKTVCIRRFIVDNLELSTAFNLSKLKKVCHC
jgi:hypothetical protein